MTKDLYVAPSMNELATSAVSTPESVFERLARDPGVDVDKLERLMQMHERATARRAEEEFNAAMSEAQTDMRPVAADADNPQTRSRYASYNALDRALRPIYTRHGFGLSFDTGQESPAGWVRVLCYVTHKGGHARTYHVDMPADGKGAKGGDVMTKTHAAGAAMSYGARYLLKGIFNISIGEDDDDGNGAGNRHGMSEQAIADWKAAIEDAATIEAWEDVWGRCAKATTAARDVPAHEELKAAAAAKRKTLKAAKQEQTL